MRIDTERVIYEVHLRPLLWNKSDVMYRNREGTRDKGTRDADGRGTRDEGTRDAAWLEISNELVPEYENLSEEEQREIDKKIQQRWRTARDTYKKDKFVKHQPSGTKKKKYAYYDMMTFLDNEISSTDDSVSEARNLTTPSPPTTAAWSPSYSIPSQQPSTSFPPHQSHSTPRPVKQKKKKPSDFEIALLECLKNNQPQLEGEDLAFFQSLQPSLKKFTIYQKMVFRTKVMQIIIDMEKPETE